MPRIAVYVCDSEPNRTWIERLGPPDGVLSFPWPDEQSAETVALAALKEYLDDWGGSAFEIFDPWWSDMGFFGVRPSPDLLEHLSLCGANRVEETPDGFVASRRPSSASPWPYPSR